MCVWQNKVKVKHASRRVKVVRLWTSMTHCAEKPYTVLDDNWVNRERKTWNVQAFAWALEREGGRSERGGESVRGRKVAVLAATHYILLLRTLIEWSIAATPEQCQDNGAAKPGQVAAAPGPGANLLLSHNLRQLIGSCLPSSKEGAAVDLLLGQQLSKSTIVRTADLSVSSDFD